MFRFTRAALGQFRFVPSIYLSNDNKIVRLRSVECRWVKDMMENNRALVNEWIPDMKMERFIIEKAKGMERHSGGSALWTLRVTHDVLQNKAIVIPCDDGFRYL